MKTILIAAHASFSALWLGCILTEALFERALLPKGQDGRLTLAHLHVRVDKIVELPAIFGVLFTGLFMLLEGGRGGLAFHTMLGAGVLAVTANLYCVWLVFQRRDAAVSGNWQRFQSLDHLQHKLGAVVLIGVLAALVAGYWGRSVA